MKKTVEISEPHSARATPPGSWPDRPQHVTLAAAALAYKSAVASRVLAVTHLTDIRQQCADAERMLTELEQEISSLKQALAKAALE